MINKGGVVFCTPNSSRDLQNVIKRIKENKFRSTIQKVKL